MLADGTPTSCLRCTGRFNVCLTGQMIAVNNGYDRALGEAAPCG